MTVLDGLVRAMRRARERNYEIARVRVVPFVDRGAVAPRGREVWLHPADLMEALCDPMLRMAGTGQFGRPDNLLGIPVVHGIERVAA